MRTIPTKEEVLSLADAHAKMQALGDAFAQEYSDWVNSKRSRYSISCSFRGIEDGSILLEEYCSGDTDYAHLPIEYLWTEDWVSVKAVHDENTRKAYEEQIKETERLRKEHYAKEQEEYDKKEYKRLKEKYANKD